VTLADGSALPDVFKWDPIDRMFSYHSIVESDAAEYNIKMTASVSANFQDSGFTKDLTFKVDVQNGCATDNIGFDSYITDYVYYLGVVTDEDSEWEYATGKALKAWDIGVTHTEIGCPVTFSLMRMITTTTGTEEVTLTPEQDAVFSDLTITEDNQSYNLHFEAITDNE
jgi:hypothetical protein